MAKLDAHGFDMLEKDLTVLRDMSTEEKNSILTAGGNVIKAKMQELIGRLGLIDSGVLQKSIAVVLKKNGEAQIYPKGKHHNSKGKSVNAAEVGFIQEYGAPGRGIKATHWMETAVEEAGPETAQAMQDKLNEIIDRKTGG